MYNPLAPNLRDVFAYIDEHSQTFLARLIDYLRHPSISAYGEGIAEVAEYIADVMRRMGLAVQIIPTSGWPIVFGEYHARHGTPTVLLYGHYDVQPPDPLDEWISPPFGVPYANPDESNHAPNENMEVARFFMGIKTGAAMLSYVGTMPNATVKS